MEENIVRFDELSLRETLLSTLNEMGFTSPTPIQAAAIPFLMEGRDVWGKAQTGTGKTAAFSLPLLSKLDVGQHKPQAIVITPTRELAIQVATEIKKLGRSIQGLKVLEIYGGASIVDQIRALRLDTHIVVGTPGRVKDLIERNRLRLDECHTFILDEADEMLKMGFVDDVTWIMEKAPGAAQRILFSATMPPAVKSIMSKFLREPAHVDVAGSSQTIAKVKQQFWVVRGVDKDEAMIRLLETEAIDASIVFVRTRQETERLADWLTNRGFKAAALHGDVPQSLRERTVSNIKGGSVSTLIATDVAARGLDVPRVTHVFNYDIPFDVESYIHRIGRTGRAGRAGKTILFVRANQIRMLRSIERVTRLTMEEISLPLRTEVAESRLVKFGERLKKEIEKDSLEKFSELVDRLQVSLNLDTKTLAAILLKGQQGKRPFFYTGEDPILALGQSQPLYGERRRGNPRPASKQGWATYHLKIGRIQGVRVKDIVGALANELGLTKNSIGTVRLKPESTLVQLPKNMSPGIIRKLRTLRICRKEVSPTRCSFNHDLRGRNHRYNGGHNNVVQGAPNHEGR